MATAVQMPKHGNTVEECLLVEWRVKEGDRVGQGDVICSIETDKASFEVESTADGMVLKLLANAGDLVSVLTDIAIIGDAGEKVEGATPAKADASAPTAQPTASASVAAPAPSPAAAPARPGEFKAVSPRARKLAEKLGVDVAAVSGTGAEGRVTSRDIQAAVDSGAAIKASPLAKAIMAAEGTVPVAGTGIGGLALARDLGAASRRAAAMAVPVSAPETIPYTGIRKLIGERMLQSLAEHAQLTHTTSADASGLKALRTLFKENAEAVGLPKLTINDLICWVVCQTLPSFPELNATLDKAAGIITRSGEVNLAFAVDTPRGLMVPVVPGANRMGLAELSRAMASHAEACRKGGINPDFLIDGTFTVSNLGSFGIESFTPIINGNQAAILGVCAIRDVPAPTPGGGFEFRPRLGLSLTYDHQAVDGAPASRFLQAVAKGIESVQGTLALYGSF